MTTEYWPDGSDSNEGFKISADQQWRGFRNQVAARLMASYENGSYEDIKDCARAAADEADALVAELRSRP